MNCLVRLLASLLIALSLALGGSYLAWLDAEKVLRVRSILQMINVIETRLRFCATPVSELLTLIEASDCKGLDFVKNCKTAMENGEPFFLAWELSIKSDRFLTKLMPEETQKLIDMGADIGVTDIEGQLSCCGYYGQIFTGFLEANEEKSKRSSKLFPPLGILMGISAAIFLQ